eukprot:COSAG05_NODE_515_length_9075_cov_121.644719_2_plen_76_part_00
MLRIFRFDWSIAGRWQLTENTLRLLALQDLGLKLRPLPPGANVATSGSLRIHRREAPLPLALYLSWMPLPYVWGI